MADAAAEAIGFVATDMEFVWWDYIWNCCWSPSTCCHPCSDGSNNHFLLKHGLLTMIVAPDELTLFSDPQPVLSPKRSPGRPKKRFGTDRKRAQARKLEKIHEEVNHFFIFSKIWLLDLGCDQPNIGSLWSRPQSCIQEEACLYVWEPSKRNSTNGLFSTLRKH